MLKLSQKSGYVAVFEGPNPGRNAVGTVGKRHMQIFGGFNVFFLVTMFFVFGII